MKLTDEAVEAAAAKLPPIWTSSPTYRANLIQALEAAAPQQRMIADHERPAK